MDFLIEQSINKRDKVCLQGLIMSGKFLLKVNLYQN